MRIGLLRGFYKPRATGHEPRATFKNPHPGPPQRGGRFALLQKLRDAGVESSQNHEPQATKSYYKLQATSYRPQTGFLDSPDEAGQPDREPGPMPEEKPRSSCRRHVKRWNVGEGLKPSPTAREPRTEHGVSTGHRPRATGHPITTYHVLRTTYYAPRTHRADTPVRPYDGIKRAPSHEPQPQATSYKPQAAVSSFQPSEPVGPARSPSLAGVARNDGGDAEPLTRLLKRSGPQLPLGGRGKMPVATGEREQRVRTLRLVLGRFFDAQEKAARQLVLPNDSEQLGRQRAGGYRVLHQRRSA